MFSVIIPLYNKQSFIRDTIYSVLNQSFINFEIIIVNDSSTDNSLQIVSSILDERIRVFTKKNEGVASARNFGIEKAKNRYLAFLDADDLWAPNHLENLKLLISNYSNAKLYISSYARFVNSISNLLSVSNLKAINKDNNFLISDYFKYRIKSNHQFCWTSAVCVDKNVFKLVDGFPNGISRGEDLDLWTRIALISPFAYSNMLTAYYRVEVENSLNTTYNSWKESFKYWEWFNYENNSKYFNDYVNLMIYSLAVSAFKNKKYKDVLIICRKCRGLYKFHKRIAIIIMSLFRILFEK